MAHIFLPCRRKVQALSATAARGNASPCAIAVAVSCVVPRRRRICAPSKKCCKSGACRRGGVRVCPSFLSENNSRLSRISVVARRFIRLRTKKNNTTKGARRAHEQRRDALREFV